VVFSIIVQGLTLGTVIQMIGSRANLEFNSCAQSEGDAGAG